jgi:hypothetical protein
MSRMSNLDIAVREYIADMQRMHDKANDEAHLVVKYFASGMITVDELVDAIRKIDLPPLTTGIIDKTCGLRVESTAERALKHANWKDSQEI